MAETKTAVASPPREIAPRVWWLPQCDITVLNNGVPGHVHTAPYVILGDDQTLLWDTTFDRPELTDAFHDDLERLLDGRPLDWIVVSHPEVAHIGGLRRLMDTYPDARVPGDLRDYHLYYPQYEDRFVPMELDATIDLGGESFVLLPAVIKDLPTTQWGYAKEAQVLFVVDALAYAHKAAMAEDPDEDRPVHLPSECGLMVTELDAPPHPEQISWIASKALYWSRFVKIDHYRKPFEEVLERYPSRLIAPAHGAVIDDLDAALPVVFDALGKAYEGK